jgi:hypothetical protein
MCATLLTAVKLIEPHDRPILDFLTDIKLELIAGENPGFRLVFAFAKNEFFKNEVRTSHTMHF